MDPKHNQAVDETNMSIEQSMPRHPLTGEGTMWLTAERCSENEAILSSSMYKDYILIYIYIYIPIIDRYPGCIAIFRQYASGSL